MMGGQQLIILKEGTEREKGKRAVFNNIAAARAVAHAGKSTLGPKGMDEVLVDSLGDVEILKDGVTLLKEIETQAPTPQMPGRVAETAACDAVQRSVEECAGEGRADVDNILVQKKHGGNLTDTTLIDGIVLDKERVRPRMAKFVRDAKIALINRALEVKKTEVNEEIRSRDPAKLQMFLDEEEKSLRTMVEKIKASGANVVLCQKGIDDVAQHYLAKEGIYAVRRVKESDMKKLAKATGARSVTNLDDLSPKELGKADLVEERKIGTDDMTFVTGNKKARAVSILVRGGTEHVVDEVERILHDALRVVAAAIEDGKAIAGGGSAEVELSLALKSYAATVGGREQLAIEAFAKALEVIPRTLGQNAGLDPIDVLIKLRAEHGKKNSKSMGVNVATGEPMDMLKANIVEPLRVKTQEIDSAAEVASMILRIDDVIASKKSPPPPPGGGEHGHGGGMGGMC